ALVIRPAPAKMLRPKRADPLASFQRVPDHAPAFLVYRSRILVLLVALLAFAAWPGSSTFTVSPQTTYVTGPLDKDGYVDYVTSLNERLSQGITPENNANVLIWQALGPRPEGGDPMPEEYWKWLGIAAPPEEGEHFVSYRHYLELHVEVFTDKRE